MAWTGQSFSVGQILTAAQMGNLQADITAQANGDSGAPKQQTAGMAASSVTQATIGPGAVGAGEIINKAVDFTSKIKTFNSNYDFTAANINFSTTFPGGLFTRAVLIPSGSNIFGTLYIEQLINGSWDILESISVSNGAGTMTTNWIIGDLVNTRIRWVYSSGGSTPFIVRFKRMY